MGVDALPNEPQPAAVSAPVGEVDVWWDGYAVRALLPSFIVCVLLSAGIIAASYYLWGEHGLRANLVRWLAYELNIALWLYHAARWAWRLGGNIYRLTTRRLYCWRRILSRPHATIELPAIRAVLVEQTPFEQWLKVGSIIVQAEGQLAPIRLRGVRSPRQRAELIRQQVEKSRAAT
jgi:hypothetical protein